MSWWSSTVGTITKPIGRAAKDFAHTAKDIVSDPGELAVTAVVPAYALHRTKTSKRITKTIAKADVPVISKAVAAQAIATGALERVAKGKLPTKKQVAKAATLAAEHAANTPQGKRFSRKVKSMNAINAARRAARRVPSMAVPHGSSKGDALATAGRLVASMNSGDPRLKKYAQAVMNATAARARLGDVDAQRAVSAIKAAQSASKAKGKLHGFLVTSTGRVVIGDFIQVG